MTKVFESPDGGKTVYEREIGSPNRKLIMSAGVEDLLDYHLWNEIRSAAKTNPALQKACDRVKLLYKLTKEHK